MSRLSFRPRPLDIHKRLPVIKNLKDFEDDETPAHFFRLSVEPDIEVQPQFPTKKVASEIPTPEFVVVGTYERDYTRTFNQPTSYLRARGARAEIGEFVEYDLDNEDEDWIKDFNRDRKTLEAEKFETILFKLEALDHKARERAGIITPTTGSPIPVLLTLDTAVEALQALSIKFGVFRSIYNYWRGKRERWQKPILRRLQPPPPVNDTNPYNVFRPREKAHRLHTRRMQRRENNVQSFEKLRQVRRNLDQGKTLLEAVIKREERKRDVMESEVSLQRIQMKYKNEPEFLEDSLATPGLPIFSSKFVTSDDEFVDSDDASNSLPQSRPSMLHSTFKDPKPVIASAGGTGPEFRPPVPYGWLHKLDPHEPVLLFTKPIEPGKLAAAGIIPPPDSSVLNGASSNSFMLRGRIGRGGRIIFDRCNPLVHDPIDCGYSLNIHPKPQQLALRY